MDFFESAEGVRAKNEQLKSLGIRWEYRADQEDWVLVEISPDDDDEGYEVREVGD